MFSFQCDNRPFRHIGQILTSDLNSVALMKVSTRNSYCSRRKSFFLSWCLSVTNGWRYYSVRHFIMSSSIGQIYPEEFYNFSFYFGLVTDIFHRVISCFFFFKSKHPFYFCFAENISKHLAVFTDLNDLGCQIWLHHSYHSFYL